jgi:hypothetical protein
MHCKGMNGYRQVPKLCRYAAVVAGPTELAGTQTAEYCTVKQEVADGPRSRTFALYALPTCASFSRVGSSSLQLRACMDRVKGVSSGNALYGLGPDRNSIPASLMTL